MEDAGSGGGLPVATPARAGAVAPAIAACGELVRFDDGDTTVEAIVGRRVHDGVGTMFVLARDRLEVSCGRERYPVPPDGYAVLPTVATVEGGLGLAITARSHRGLFTIGGPVESTGRLRYIDGCTDTLLVPPVVLGDPCLNLLHIPPRVRQTDHEHPSLRAGVIVSGTGRCVLSRERSYALWPGVAFTLPAGQTHRFETEDEDLRVLAWHPDSDIGPTDHDHPMLNRTLRPGTTDRVR